MKTVRCQCGRHQWSDVTPKTIHLTNAEDALRGITWAQLGKQVCIRPGCSKARIVVRDGGHGSEAFGCNTKWGKSRLTAVEVEKLPLCPEQKPAAFAIA